MVTLQHELVATLAIADVIVGYDSMDSLVHVVEISESINVQCIVVIVVIIVVVVIVVIVIIAVVIIVIIIIVVVIVLVVTRLVIVVTIIIIVVIIINSTLLEFYYSFSHQFLTLHKIIRCFACIRQLHSLQTIHVYLSNHSTTQTPDRECVIVLETTPFRYKDFEERQIYHAHHDPDPNLKTSRYTPFVCDPQMLPFP